MDFEHPNDGIDLSQPPEEPQQGPAQVKPIVTKPVKKRTGWLVFLGIFAGLSVLANIIMFLMLIGLVAIFATGQRGIFTEEVIQSGPRANKIVVVSVDGVIDSDQSRDVYRQLKTARKDRHVKGVIVRVNSPGGTMTGSDQIYNEILKYRQRTKKPVVAYMEGVAASGGYYTSVACEKIVAEPTTITGSVGVIMGYLVLQELLEGKLGIQPIIIKSGEKKDWPSSFRYPTEEEIKYLEDKLLTPAYERFVEVVAEGRESLTLAEVKRLSDGSIYSAQEALDEKLIDKIGYLDDAIEVIKEMAGIEKAHVVEYRKPFSLPGFLGGSSTGLLEIDKTKLYELSTPEVLYLWRGY